VGDFTDFSCSKDHALNASEAVFGQRNLPPGFEHFPIGYHGRSSTLFVSGTDIVRPKGQFKNDRSEVEFGPTRRLDYELEVGAVIREGRKIERGSGEGVTVADADEWIFGVVMVNDWSGESMFSSLYLTLFTSQTRCLS
jgi:fumarylacetoacetase